MTPVMTRVIAKLVFPIILMIAGAQIITAGYRPGEGFTAALVAALAVLIQYVAFGYRKSQKYLPIDKMAALAPAGLVLASLGAVLPLVFGAPLLAQFHTTVQLPVWGDIKLATDVLLDLGVFLVVFGGVMSMLKHLKELR
jgi:multisubunit Na+/H+ antiporter MnhB subunit